MILDSDQQAFVDAVADYCRQRAGTREQRDALTLGDTQANNRGILDELGELGWLGVSLPEAYGGGGMGMVEECLFLEHTIHGQIPVTGYSTSLTAGQSYLRWATEEQKLETLGGICRGRLEAISLSEPGAGSDLAGARCRATRDGDGWVIDGQKTWCSIAHVSDHVLVLTRTGGERHRGLTLLQVPTDHPGLEIRAIETMEARTVNDLFFTDCRVPADAIVGKEGEAWAQLMPGLAVERLIIAAMSVGAAQRALDDVIAYVSERQQFNRTIGSFQAVRHRIADLATEVECARALTYDVAQHVDQHDHLNLPRAVNRQASMAKLKATEVAKHAALEGMQLMGGYGYAKEYDMERHVRIALAPPIYGGANEVQREIIGKSYGL
ncbi:acyl-CoA dehydrogenase family protein [Patulibacter sp. NPDC049589]|uniref:acyl-CoA dehydrogenase family protein n=1 Tax=Patulibacter sp. NPDC049589 TaxID=3154731 RepID=UPI00341245FD